MPSTHTRTLAGKTCGQNIMPERTLAGYAVGQHITFISDLALFLGQTSAGLSSTGECIALSKFFANSNPMAAQLSTADAAIPPNRAECAFSGVRTIGQAMQSSGRV